MGNTAPASLDSAGPTMVGTRPIVRLPPVLGRSVPKGSVVPLHARLVRFRRCRLGAPRCRLFLALCAAALAPAGPAAAQGMVRKTFEDWQLRCETPAGAKAEQCALVQYLAAEDRPNLTLVVIVLKTADNRGYLLRVVAPLGVLLPSGLGLKIDQTDIGRAGFVRCLTTGCVAEVVMDDGLIRQFKSGIAGDLHRVPDAGGRRRHPAVDEGLRGRVRQPEMTMPLGSRAMIGHRTCPMALGRATAALSGWLPRARRLASRRAPRLRRGGQRLLQPVQVRRHDGSAVAAREPRSALLPARRGRRRRRRAAIAQPLAGGRCAPSSPSAALARECTRRQDGSITVKVGRRGQRPARARRVRRAGSTCRSRSRSATTARSSRAASSAPA